MNPDELGAVTVECMVLDCATTRSHYGPWVKLALENPEHARHFRKGQRLIIACALMHDEEPEPPRRKEITQHRPYRPSQLAGMMAHSPDFWRFVHDQYGFLCETAERCAQWQREACGVKSRADLDKNPVAARVWAHLLSQFDVWRGPDDEG